VLEEMLAARFREHDFDSWIQRLTDADAIFAPVRGLADVFADPYIAKTMVARMTHPKAGDISLLANPIKFSATPASVDLAPPVLGEHTDEVLAGLDGPGDGSPWRAGKGPEG